MPLTSQALTTVDAVREYAQKSSGATTQDSVIANLINRASALIIRYTSREFVADAIAGNSRVFEYNGNGSLDLCPYDLRAITSVTMDTETTAPTLVATADYALRPKPARDGVYQWLTLPMRVRESSEVTVVGTWGFASVPLEVEDACIKTVLIWLRRDVAAFTSVFNLDESRVERPESLPSAVRRALDPFRRVEVA